MQARYRVNSPDVASQIVDGEAILIHFDTGSYYAADGSGGEVLDLIERGRSISEIVDDFAIRYAVAPSEIESAVAKFLDQLLVEQLVVPAMDATIDGEITAGRATASSGPGSARFQPPTLEKHSELEDLLRLDPMHDVDEAGWPSVDGH